VCSFWQVGYVNRNSIEMSVLDVTDSFSTGFYGIEDYLIAFYQSNVVF